MVDTVKSYGRIASHIPGRLRFRLNRRNRHPELMRRIHMHFTKQEGIHHIDTNTATGSILVRYDTHKHTYNSLLAMLKDIGVIICDGMEEGNEDVFSDVRHCTASTQIINTIGDLDHQLYLMTGGKADLKLILPLLMGILGIYQIKNKGWGISEIPGYVLLWYAIDAFYKFHQQPPGEKTPKIDPI